MTLSRRDFMAMTGSGALNLSIVTSAFGEESLTKDGITTTVSMRADVLVAGGGLAGVCAAIAAARNGASVLLVQDRSRLGGNSSSEIRMHVCGANNSTATALWRETGIIEEIKLTEAATNPQRSFPVWDLILYDKVVSEPLITLLLDTAVIGATVEGEHIKSIEAICPAAEERYHIEATSFIDCTGDGTLAWASGAKYRRGREGREVFGEALAPEQGDEKTMGNSLLFFAQRHDKPMPFAPPAWARKFTKEDFLHRPIRSWEYGYWWIEWGGELDTIADNRRIRHELLRILLGVWDYIKNSGNHPDSANWALDFVGMLPGKRESRRIIGAHTLIQSEIERAELFEDRVAYGGWPMDDHPPGGMDARDLPPCTQIRLNAPYSIPLRALYSESRPNLFMAGRNISVSHVALSTTRVMATCATLGQAVGTAAAACTLWKCAGSDLATVPAIRSRFQQLLLKDDQSLLGVRNEDLNDLARGATVSCSNEEPEALSAYVIDGFNRDVGDGCSHQWRSSILVANPWIMLSWSSPKRIGLVQIIFDSGLHRRLFLSGEDSTYFAQTRGPQPELVAEYTVEGLVDGAWRTLAEEKNNFLRLRRHTFEPIALSGLRIRVLRTHGDEKARIFEVRCYDGPR